ncbi:MAG: efflux RND transporter permease subunit, partial [Planctomycetota bacterium]
MRGALAWAARNPVFANLLMGFLIAAGLFASVHLVREMFPEFSFDTVTVTVVYPGATPEEIERGITLKVEEAIEALEGIRKIESTSSEGVCVVRAEIDDTLIDPADALTRIRNAVDEITTLPEDAERPQVELSENRREVASIVLAADVDEASLAALARELEAQLLALPGVREVTIEGLREREIAIECDEAALQRHGLDLDAVARAVAQANLELPLGTLRTEREERLLRVAALREHASQLADIPVLERPDGTVVRLGEVAQLRDGFVLEPGWARLDGKRAVRFDVLRSKSADTIELAGRIKDWIEQRRHALPEGVRLLLWRDGARSVVERLELLGRNGLQGLALVFGILLLFLGWRLSFWVAFGLPVAFLTTLLLLWWVGATLNMITSFALIMVLGILVDDSIVVAENIARHMRERGHTVAAAVSGLLEVAWPVVASVTTTVLAFVPLFFIGGTMGKFIRIMPVAVVACLLASLLEALLILPAHLAHSREPAPDRVGRRRPLHALHLGTERLLRRFVEGPFRRSLAWAIRWRYVVAALAFAFVVVVGGLAAGGRPAFVFFPRLDTEFVDAQLRMPVGTAIGVTDEVVRRLERAGERLREELPLADDGAPIVRNVFSLASGPGTATVVLRLSPSQLRSVTGLEIIKRWRALAGELGQVQSVV